MPILIADIGGTNARFALIEGGIAGPAHHMALDAFASITAAIAAFLATLDPPQRPSAALLAVAGPVAGNRVRLTNRGWVVDGTAIGLALDIPVVHVVNDFAALSWSLPVLGPTDLVPLGGGAAKPGAPMAVLGPGTGLGVGAFLPPDRVLVTEGGHASLAAHDAREAGVIEWLRARHDAWGGHVSAERALSGQGLQNLHAALAALDSVAAPPRDAASIVATALADDCAVCREALAMFCAMLGGVAGNLALLYGAAGGVFVAGGICPRFPAFLAASEFRARFEAKGRFRDWLAPVPAWLVVRPDVAMLGLAAMAERLPDATRND